MKSLVNMCICNASTIMSLGIDLKKEFQNALKKGLGRVFLYVKKHGDSLVKEDILNACTKNGVYDAQVEAPRAQWLLSLIDLTNNSDFYFPKLIESLHYSECEEDIHLLSKICEILAKRNIEGAKKALYKKYNAYLDNSYYCAKSIINLDGLEGIIYVAETVGKRLLEDESYSAEMKNWGIDDSLFFEAYDKFGKENVLNYLLSSAQFNSHVKSFIQIGGIKNHAEIKKNRKYSLKTVLQSIEAKEHSPYFYTRFGKYASQKEIDIIFKCLLKEKRIDQLIRYLRVFTERSLPCVDNLFFELAYSDNYELQINAITALSNNQDPSIRQLAIKLCENSGPDCVISLFNKNYEYGDFKFFENIIEKVNDEHLIHDRCQIFLDLLKNNSHQELSHFLLWVYENSPCVVCRSDAIKQLISLKLLPKEIKIECQFDSEESIRQLVKD